MTNTPQTSRSMGVSAAQMAIQETLEASEAQAKALSEAKQDASEDTLKSETEGNFTAAGIAKRTAKLEPRQDTKKAEKKDVQESVLVRKEDADGLADEFSQRKGNREYHLDSRLLSQIVAEELGSGITENSSSEEIIALISRRMTVEGQSSDVVIIDKAFAFLLEVTKKQLDLAKGANKERLRGILRNLELAKNKHFDEHSHDIQFAQKIIDRGVIEEVVQETGQTFQDTLSDCREFVHNPTDLQTLRKSYEVKGFEATEKELKVFRLYLGKEVKRPGLERAELVQLASAVQKLQDLHGVFRSAQNKRKTVMRPYLESHHVFSEAA